MTHPSKLTRQMSTPPTLESRIRACYAALPGSEIVVADLLLHHPGRLATHSATELAADASASKAAVTRLVQRLGYVSYAAARAEARDAQQWGSPVYLEAGSQTATSGAGGPHAAFSHHVAADQQLLARTLGALSDAALERAVERLAKARRLVVVGFRNSAWLAIYARSQLGLLRAGVELAPMPAETLAEGLVGLGPGDTVLALGFRRRVPAFAAALRTAHAAGVAVVLLTDPSGAADLGFVDCTLCCHCSGASLFDSYAGAVSLLNFLATQLAQALGDDGLERLQDVETWHRQLGDLA